MKNVLLFSLALGWQTTTLAVNSPTTPDQHIEKPETSGDQEDREKAISVQTEDKDNLAGDYVMAILSAVIGIFLPGLIFTSAYVSAIVAILLLATPLVLSLIVFGRHGKRKKAGRKTPFFIRLLAGIGLGFWAVWVVWAIASGGF